MKDLSSFSIKELREERLKRYDELCCLEAKMFSTKDKRALREIELRRKLQIAENLMGNIARIEEEIGLRIIGEKI